MAELTGIVKSPLPLSWWMQSSWYLCNLVPTHPTLQTPLPTFTPHLLSLLIAVLVSYGCWNRLPHIWWAKTIEIYSLAVLGARSLKSRCQQGYDSCESSREGSCPCLLQFLVVPVFPQFVAACLLSLPSSSQHLLYVLPNSIYVFSSLIRTLVIGLRAHLNNPGWPHLEILSLIASIRTFSQIRSHSQVRGGHIFWAPCRCYWGDCPLSFF